jgi:nitroreductase
MKAAREKPTAANLRSWRVIIMRSKGEYLGSVEAPNRERAEVVAIKQFD